MESEMANLLDCPPRKISEAAIWPNFARIVSNGPLWMEQIGFGNFSKLKPGQNQIDIKFYRSYLDLV